MRRARFEITRGLNYLKDELPEIGRSFKIVHFVGF
jgi:hypothetical protein